MTSRPTTAWSAGWSFATTGVAVVAFALRRRVVNCACFGRFVPQPLRWWMLVEDAAFVALAAWVPYRAA